MKIRTDFVTNSSSSSFIFKEYNQAMIKEAVEKRLSIPPEDKWDEKYYEYTREMTPYIVGTRFREHPLCDLMEVYSWYRDEVISKLLGITYWEDWDDRTRWNSEIDNALSEKVYVSDVDGKWTAMFILDVYDNYLNGLTFWEAKEKSMEVSFDFVNSQIWEYMQSWNIENNKLQSFYVKNIELLLEGVKEFEGKQIGDVMEYLFDAKYLYFYEEETHYLICEALEEAGVCLYSWGHMG